MKKKEVRCDGGVVTAFVAAAVVVVDTAACMRLSRDSVPEVHVNVQSLAFAILPLHLPLCFSKRLLPLPL